MRLNPGSKSSATFKAESDIQDIETKPSVRGSEVSEPFKGQSDLQDIETYGLS